MVDFGFFATGIYGLSRAHRANLMAGHLGAAVVAGYFFGEQHRGLDPIVHAGIEKELDRIIRGEESAFSPGENAGITVSELFEPYPEEAPQEGRIDAIAQALSCNIDGTRASGHNVIFAAIAIRALKDHPKYATPSLIEGVRKLVQGFDGKSPGSGYYGEKRGRIDGDNVSLSDDDDFPPYANLQAMAEVVLDELIHTAAEHRQGFGGLWHVINHAAALVELARYGYDELACKGLDAHHRHMRLWRSLPNVEDELGAQEPAEHDPRTPAYWESGVLKRDSARLTHRVKTLYGFFCLARVVEDSARLRQAEDRLRYLM